jgi:hypothetical protein
LGEIALGNDAVERLSFVADLVEGGAVTELEELLDTVGRLGGCKPACEPGEMHKRPHVQFTARHASPTIPAGAIAPSKKGRGMKLKDAYPRLRQMDRHRPRDCRKA